MRIPSKRNEKLLLWGTKLSPKRERQYSVLRLEWLSGSDRSRGKQSPALGWRSCGVLNPSCSREPNVVCDTSPPITLPSWWPAAYVFCMRHWIPNQTLWGRITVWKPNPLWTPAFKPLPQFFDATTAQLQHYCRHVPCPEDTFSPGSPVHSSCRLRARDNLNPYPLQGKEGWGVGVGGVIEIKTAADPSKLKGINHFSTDWGGLCGQCCY